MEMGGKFKEDRSVVSSQLSAVSRIGHKGRIGPIVAVKAPSIESWLLVLHETCAAFREVQIWN
jgi:hypothetical protein